MLLIVIHECPTLSIRVCFGQVCLSPAKTYFSNYRSPPPVTLPSSLWKSFPPLPDQPPLSEVLALCPSLLSCPPSLARFLTLSMSWESLYAHVGDLSTQRDFASVHQSDFSLLSHVDDALSRAANRFYRGITEMTSLSLRNGSGRHSPTATLFVESGDALRSSRLSPRELARASAARSGERRWSFRPIYGVSGRDALATTQASPHGQSAAFPATSLFRDGQSKRGEMRGLKEAPATDKGTVTTVRSRFCSP